jgi:hypothetical protein
MIAKQKTRILAYKNDKLFNAIGIIPIKLNKCSIMAAGKMRSNKTKIYISSCSTMKIFNEVNVYFNSQD